jgi:hypothetical protein
MQDQTTRSFCFLVLRRLSVRQKYSSRTGSRVLYFSPVEFFSYLVVPSSMSYETESEFQIAARTRGASCVAIRRAPQLRPRISLIPHQSLAQRRFTSEGLLITTASRILIVTPRLEFHASARNQTLPAISNRYKLRLLQLRVTCTSRFAAVPSSLQPLIPRLQNLIANLELEFRVTPIRITKLQFSNRKFFAISSSPTRATNRESQATEFLIENARLNSELSVKDPTVCKFLIENGSGFPVPLSANPARYQAHLRISKPLIPNLPAARRIRDTCTDIPSLRAFLRCYASCGSRRKSE